MSDTAVPPPTTSTIQPAVDPATSSEPVAVTSEPVDKPAMATDTNVARTASDGEGGRSPTGTKRKSALGGFFADLKKALPKSNKQQQQGQGQATSDAATPTATAHPGTIISDQSHTKGAQPVVPRDPTRKAHRGLLTGVDAIVSKEAERIMNSMSGMVENSGNNQSNGDIPLNIRDTMYPPESETHEHELPQHKQKWMSNWETATIDKLFTSRHMGNYVIVDRQTGAKVFESMPIFTRLGMHLLFVSSTTEFLDLKAVEKLFADLSIRQGRMYDNPDPKFYIPHIQSFIKTYNIATDQLLEPDISKYKNFNAFFSRQLKPSARPVTDPEDLSVLTSPADSRLTVFENIDAAKKFWIKGKQFTLAHLLDDPHLAEKFGANPSIAIFRLAPQDYHRFHSPFRATLGKRSSIHGTYYTVNPQAINENLNVFTANHRQVQIMNVFTSVPSPEVEAEIAADNSAGQGSAPPNTVPFALVAVGAMLVGSIGWSKVGGQEVQKGEDLGFFQYGGSTTILVAPEGKVVWDADLIKSSEMPLESLVRVGEKIGRINF